MMYSTKVVRLLHTRTFLMTIKKSRFFFYGGFLSTSA